MILIYAQRSGWRTQLAALSVQHKIIYAQIHLTSAKTEITFLKLWRQYKNKPSFSSYYF